MDARLAELAFSLMAFAGAETGLPVPDGLPSIEFHSACEIHAEFMSDYSVPCKAIPGEGIIAFYNPDENRLVLPDYWSPDSLNGRVAMVHELTHYLQDMAGISAVVQCPAQLEQQAYQASFAYVQENKLDPWTFHNLDRITLMTLQYCPAVYGN